MQVVQYERRHKMQVGNKWAILCVVAVNWTPYIAIQRYYVHKRMGQGKKNYQIRKKLLIFKFIRVIFLLQVILNKLLTEFDRFELRI